MNKREELQQLAAELDGLPMPIDQIIELEDMGFAVDLETGEVTRDTDTFTLTLYGEVWAILISKGVATDGD